MSRVITVEGEDRRGLPSTALGINAPSWVKGHPLAAFFVLAFVLTWSVEIPARLFADQIGVLQIVVGWLPGLAALIAAGLTVGLPGQSAWLARGFIGRVGRRWYFIALFGALPIWLGALALDRYFGGSGIPSVDLLNTDVVALIAPVIGNFVVYLVLSTEELAWRGFALPRLQARRGALVASLIIGVVSAIWYLPSVIFDATTSIEAEIAFFVGTIALSVVYGWIFNNTRGSVLLCGLAHAATNTWTDVISAPPADHVLSQWIYTALLLAVAAIIAIIFGPSRLSRRPAGEIPLEPKPSPVRKVLKALP